jgi:hypothetical protein
MRRLLGARSKTELHMWLAHPTHFGRLACPFPPCRQGKRLEPLPRLQPELVADPFISHNDELSRSRWGERPDEACEWRISTSRSKRNAQRLSAPATS